VSDQTESPAIPNLPRSEENLEMKKYIIWLNVVMILFMLLSACAQPTQEATQQVETEAEAPEEPEAQEPEAMPEDITIGAVLFGRDSFFENIQTGMELAAEELGVELLVSIHDHDIAKETEFIEDYIARGVDAIVITP
jgi:ABC-type sugar transport system substrate-binding protein